MRPSETPDTVSFGYRDVPAAEGPPALLRHPLRLSLISGEPSGRLHLHRSLGFGFG
jgi:hypothetical protein